MKRQTRPFDLALAVTVLVSTAFTVAVLAARGESPAAFGAPSAAAALGTPFGRRCIPPPPQRGCDQMPVSERPVVEVRRRTEGGDAPGWGPQRGCHAGDPWQGATTV